MNELEIMVQDEASGVRYEVSPAEIRAQGPEAKRRFILH
jgi:hypothetical protein